MNIKKRFKINVVSKENKFFIYDSKYNFIGVYDYLTQYLELEYNKKYIKINSLEGAQNHDNKTYLIFNAVLLEK